MRIDHVCIAVRSIDAAVAKLCPLLGYEPRTRKVTNSRQKSTSCSCRGRAPWT